MPGTKEAPPVAPAPAYRQSGDSTKLFTVAPRKRVFDPITVSVRVPGGKLNSGAIGYGYKYPYRNWDDDWNDNPEPGPTSITDLLGIKSNTNQDPNQPQVITRTSVEQTGDDTVETKTKQTTAMPPKESSSSYSETTPLLWPQQPQFSGSGPWPGPHQFPSNYQPGNWQQYSQQGSSRQPFQFMRWGQGQGQSQNNPKKIQHDGDLGKDPHSQFCALTGCPPTNAPPDFRYRPNEKTLYGRAVYQVRSQNFTYQLTAAATNTLLLLQIVLGAALTGLGGADIPRWVITMFGAANTIIAGLVAYLKSRGQPMRARMFRDDLERVVDEIENSEVMWLGISKNVHGYSDIDTDAEVTVRSEVARLTRLLDKAIKSNNQNNPDLYSTGVGAESTGSGTNKGNPFITLPAMVDTSQVPSLPQSTSQQDQDQAPATLTRKKTEDKKTDDASKKNTEASKSASAAAAPAPASAPAPAQTPAPTSTDKGKATETNGNSGSGSGSGGAVANSGSSGDKNNSSNTQTSNTTTSGSGGNTTTTTTSSSKQTYASTAASAPDDPDASPATATLTRKKSQPEGGPKKEAGEPDEIF